mmetsp:Transcript_22429/g.51374  ORF Transcript_22429/g.51374 Transcript_22429/m.51374 type:complete len:430 (-) Transcript_22429:74-1363(-)
MANALQTFTVLPTAVHTFPPRRNLQSSSSVLSSQSCQSSASTSGGDRWWRALGATGVVAAVQSARREPQHRFGRRCRRGTIDRRGRCAKVLQATQQDVEANPVALALRSQLSQLDTSRKGSGKDRRWEDWAYCRAIVPEQQTPWGVVHFVGGAVLGQFPDLCYDALLRPLADRCGLAIVCTPYETGPNHSELAEVVSEKFELAVEVGASRYGWPLETMPRILLGHSLGTKLQVLNLCSAGIRPLPLGVGLLAFNNYGIRDQVRLLQEALKFMQGGRGAGSILDQVLPVLATAAEKAGMEFQPSPQELLTSVQATYASRNVRTRLFRFIDDELDTSSDFLDAVEDSGSMGAVESPRLLPGGHLAPVFIAIQDIMGAGSSSAQGTPAGRVAERMAAAMGGGGAGMGMPNLGSEAEVDEVRDAVEDWIRSLR